LLLKSSRNGFFARFGKVLIIGLITILTSTTGFFIYQKLTSPVDAMFKSFTQVSAGHDHSLALASDGTIYAWGMGSDGQLGNGTTTNSTVPVAVTTTGTPMAGKTITSISAGYYHSLALASDGTVYAWGGGSDGQLGNSTTADSSVPVAVTTSGTPMSGKTITAISAGYSHSLVLASDGTVYAWGLGTNGRLGNSSSSSSNKPVAVTTSSTPMSGKTITAILLVVITP
jgi:alpha-tubulin suppressor-like RCC1 family protein